MEVEYGKGQASCTGPLVGSGCRQVFTAQADSLESVSVLFSTYGNPLSGLINVEVKDFLTRKVVAQARCGAEQIEDNAWREFGMKTRLLAWRRYELVVRAQDSRPGLSPTAFKAKKANQGSLLVGVRLQRGEELVCRLRYG